MQKGTEIPRFREICKTVSRHAGAVLNVHERATRCRCCIGALRCAAASTTSPRRCTPINFARASLAGDSGARVPRHFVNRRVPWRHPPMSSYFLSGRSVMRGPPLSPCGQREQRVRDCRCCCCRRRRRQRNVRKMKFEIIYFHFKEKANF